MTDTAPPTPDQPDDRVVVIDDATSPFTRTHGTVLAGPTDWPEYVRGLGDEEAPETATQDRIVWAGFDYRSVPGVVRVEDGREWLLLSDGSRIAVGGDLDPRVTSLPLTVGARVYARLTIPGPRYLFVCRPYPDATTVQRGDRVWVAIDPDFPRDQHPWRTGNELLDIDVRGAEPARLGGGW